MSSSNEVRLSVLEETEYGVTPDTGDFREVKFTSESLSGTPLTVESAEIRSDRQTSGQVNTGLEMTGGFDFELSADESIKFFIGQAMMSDIVPEDVNLIDFDVDAANNVLTTLDDFTTTGIKAGEIVVLSGFTNAENNVPVLVLNVTASTINYAADGLVDEVGSGTSLTVPSYYEIGTDRKSCSISKEFLDVADANVRSIAYRGMRTGEMSMAFNFGEIVTGSFALAGNGYETPTVPITDGRTVIPAGSDIPLDASNSMGWVIIDDELADICIENLSFSLNNNLTPQNCIGETAPKDQVPFSASVGIDTSMHLSRQSFDMFMPKKLTQEPISLSFYTRDFDGNGYAVTLPRVQLSFPDPASPGKDEHVMLEASGTASYDDVFGNSLRLYIF